MWYIENWRFERQVEPTNQSVELFMTGGKHNKTYQIYLYKDTWSGWWSVDFAYGRIGSSLKTGTKTPTQLAYPAAKRIYDDLVQSKLEKGYKYGQSKGVTKPAPMPEPKTVPVKLPVTVNIFDVPRGRKFR